MNDLFTGKTQRNVSYLWITGFFALLFLEGLGYIKGVPHESLFALTGVVLFFWFNRSRSPETPDPNTKVTTVTTNAVIPPDPKGAP
jgi:hypothetical protein